MEVYYDEEGDYLEIFFSKPASDYGIDIGKDITLFRYSKTNKLYGLAVLNFRKRTKNFKPVKIELSKDIIILSKIRKNQNKHHKSNSKNL